MTAKRDHTEKEDRGMLDLIKKTLLTGAGLAVMTKEKIQELVGELVKKGPLRYLRRPPTMASDNR
ncbi:MAG: hypothetical protein J7M08_01480 [Planctomycetes bacterium]|nr:hypothetical protein [Planctomycetota bacterium]